MDYIQLAPGDGLRLLAEGVDQVDGIALLEIVDDPDLACLVAKPEFMPSGTDARKIPAQRHLQRLTTSSSKSASATSSRVASGSPSRKSSTGLLPPGV